MEKVLKRFAAISLALMLMFTMGVNVFAAEGVENTSNDNSVAAVQEDEPEMTAKGAELADGTYNANGLSSSLGMFHFHDPQVVIKGENAWLITTEDSDVVKRYDGMAYGKQSEILDPADETNHTLVEGTPTATVVPIYDEDGTLQTRTFVLPVPKAVFEAGDNIYYMIKYLDGYKPTHDGDWYKASGGDYYFSGYTLEKVSDSTDLPGEESGDLSNATVDAIPAQTYSGKALTPDVVVKVGEKTLVKGTDYDVTYGDNTNAGTATVTIQGKGEYSGETTATFTINKAKNPMTVSAKAVKVKKKAVKKKAQKLAAAQVMTVSNAQGAVTYKGAGINKKSKKALKINAKTGQVKVKKKTKKGTYKMKVSVTAAGNNNYNAATVTTTIKIKVK